MILLQAAPPPVGITIDSQIIGALAGALLAALCVAVGHIYTKMSDHGERLAKVETVQMYQMRSTEQNRREVVTPNPLTPVEEAILEVVVNEGGDHVTIDELEIAAQALYRESIDTSKTEGRREKYKNLLAVVDARLALKRYEQQRQRWSKLRRFIEGLR